MKNFFFLIIIFVSSCSFQQLKPKLEPEEMKSEASEVVSIIQNKPEWLKIENTCPSEIIPKVEKEIKYLDEGCENQPKNCLEDCEKEDGNACYALALFVQKQKGFEVSEANPLFFRACKLGIISGCTNLAAYKLDVESKDEKYTTCAADTFEKTCEKDDSWGCSMYGYILAYGFGRKQNFEEALKFLRKACDKYGEEDEACISAKRLEQEILNAQKQNKKQ
jgi:TPR repeat protein